MMSARSVPASPDAALHRRLHLTHSLGALVRRAEWGFAAFAVLVQSGAIGPLLLGGGSGPLSGQDVMILRALNWPVYAGIALSVLLVPRRIWRAALSVRLVLLLVALAAASVLWSVQPASTLDGVFRFGASALLGLYLAVRFRVRDLLRIVVFALGAAAVLSVAAAVLVPSLGVGSGAHAGSWQGVFAHKNILGRTMALGAVSATLLLLEGARRRLPLAAMLLLFLSLVALSRSLTAVVVLLTVAGLVPVYLTLQREIRVWVVLVAGLLIASGSSIAFVLSNPEPIMAALGRDSSLTGRTVLWVALLDLAQQRPWLGYGYSAFWGGSDAPSLVLRSDVGWQAAHAHNGFLDLWLQLGLLGTLTFLLGALSVCRSGWRMARAEARSPLATWPLVFASFLLLQNLTESVILREHNLFWALFVAAGCAAAGARSARPGPPAASRPSPPPALRLSPGIARRLRTVHEHRA